jgi:hypothetical protein
VTAHVNLGVPAALQRGDRGRDKLLHAVLAGGGVGQVAQAQPRRIWASSPRLLLNECVS